jgi:hypothetical protein
VPGLSPRPGEPEASASSARAHGVRPFRKTWQSAWRCPLGHDSDSAGVLAGAPGMRRAGKHRASLPSCAQCERGSRASGSVGRGQVKIAASWALIVSRHRSHGFAGGREYRPCEIGRRDRPRRRSGANKLELRVVGEQLQLPQQRPCSDLRCHGVGLSQWDGRVGAVGGKRLGLSPAAVGCGRRSLPSPQPYGQALARIFSLTASAQTPRSWRSTDHPAAGRHESHSVAAPPAAPFTPMRPFPPRCCGRA